MQDKRVILIPARTQINMCWKIMSLPLKPGNSAWLAYILTIYLFSRTPTTLFILALFSKQFSTGDFCKTIMLRHWSSQGEDSICSVISNLGQRPRLRKDKGHCLHLCQSEKALLKSIELYLTQIHMKNFCVCWIWIMWQPGIHICTRKHYRLLH